MEALSNSARIVPLLFIILAAAAFVSAVTAPLVVSGTGLVLLWWGVTATALALLLFQAYMLARLRRLVQHPVEPLAPGTLREIDFDKPWKGGRP